MSTSKVKNKNQRPASTGRVRPMPRNGIPQNEPKKRVGNYLLGNTVGEGTFGKVKIAIHIPTGEKVAVKILEKKRIQDQADVRRVNREIKILKKAKHENIIQLYEVLDTPNSIYLMMENADGGEMFDYIVANRHVPERQACKFFHQILNGVEVLHKNEITHRDLKPENLLLKNSPEGFLVKIVDFGLSNTHDGGRLLSTACGSPCYAAPEMIAGKQYSGPAADTWSLGVILFALVCGHLPFEDPNTSNLYRKILSGEYKTPKWISNEVKDLIRKILETDPEKRLTISQIRNHPWCQAVPLESIPREEVSLDEVDETKQEVFKRLQEIGLDIQSVMDAVSSHACNSLSAMYYLLTQKELLKLRLSKKFSTNSARPETSGQSSDRFTCVTGLNSKIVQSLDKIPNPLESNENQKEQQNQIEQQKQPHINILEVENQSKQVNLPPKVMVPVDTIKKNTSSSQQQQQQPTKPQIPKLNIKSGQNQEISLDRTITLVSQSARADNNSNNNNNPKQLAAIQNPPSYHVSGIATARPILEQQSNQYPSHQSQQQQQHHVSNNDNNDHSPNKRTSGTIIKGSTIENNVDIINQINEPGINLSIVANGVVQLPPVDVERPTTRRSKSRGAKPTDSSGISQEDCKPEGPGMGKIPSIDDIQENNNINNNSNIHAIKEPQAPREPSRSSGGGRRGKNLTNNNQNNNNNNNTSEENNNNNNVQQQQGVNLVPSPPSKPRPTAVTTITDPRSIYHGRQGIGSKPIQPLPIRVPSAPAAKPPDVSARAMAQKNKQAQQGGSIQFGGDSHNNVNNLNNISNNNNTINNNPTPTILVS